MLSNPRCLPASSPIADPAADALALLEAVEGLLRISMHNPSFDPPGRERLSQLAGRVSLERDLLAGQAAFRHARAAGITAAT